MIAERAIRNPSAIATRSARTRLCLAKRKARDGLPVPPETNSEYESERVLSGLTPTLASAGCPVLPAASGGLRGFVEGTGSTRPVDPLTAALDNWTSLGEEGVLGRDRRTSLRVLCCDFIYITPDICLASLYLGVV